MNAANGDPGYRLMAEYAAEDARRGCKWKRRRGAPEASSAPDDASTG